MKSATVVTSSPAINAGGRPGASTIAADPVTLRTPAVVSAARTPARPTNQVASGVPTAPRSAAGSRYTSAVTSGVVGPLSTMDGFACTRMGTAAIGTKTALTTHMNVSVET